MKNIIIFALLLLVSCGKQENKSADSIDELVNIALKAKSDADLIISYSNCSNSKIDISKEKDLFQDYLLTIKSRKIIKQRLIKYEDYNSMEDSPPGFEDYARPANKYNIKPSYILKLVLEAPESTSLALTFGIASINGKWNFVVVQPKEKPKEEEN